MTMSEPYAYEVRHEDEDELVYAGWLEKYATDAYRAAPRIALYKEPPASTNRLTDEQIRHLRKASAVLCGTGHHDEASTINRILATALQGDS